MFRMISIANCSITLPWPESGKGPHFPSPLTSFPLFYPRADGICLLSTAVANTITKNNLERKALFDLYILRIVCHTWKSGRSRSRNLKAGTGAGTAEECCFTGLLSVPCSACFLRQPRTTRPGVLLSIVDRVFPYQSLILKNTLHTCL